MGPSYPGTYGNMRTVVTGGEERQLMGDPAYIYRAIMEPDADVVKGCNKGLMLSYEGLISDEEIGLIIACLEHLNQQ